MGWDGCRCNPDCHAVVTQGHNLSRYLLLQTLSRAPIARPLIPVVTFLLLLNDPIATELFAALGGTPVIIVVVAIVTLLSLIQDPVAAGRRVRGNGQGGSGKDCEGWKREGEQANVHGTSPLLSPSAKSTL